MTRQSTPILIPLSALVTTSQESMVGKGARLRVANARRDGRTRDE